MDAPRLHVPPTSTYCHTCAAVMLALSSSHSDEGEAKTNAPSCEGSEPTICVWYAEKPGSSVPKMPVEVGSPTPIAYTPRFPVSAKEPYNCP